MSRLHENHNNKTDAEEIERLIAGFSPMIKKKLRNTSFQEREDLEQELKIKLFEKADMLLCQEVPGFWEFIIEYMEEN
ncbi:sigma-O factor regulator RsoA [Bacillus atrophaeus]|uniref:sigma-O factor regulator RsoA n=1 Tax=Bacillus atrophaeus TaxID=1452 RepID=UPI000B456D00|nr:sigma-O factor regulator RsoA [Bacillus atrophaeus]ARW08279.1 Sigma-O factor regulatory protein RsoA [Bacillus atrophaeus]